MFSISAGDAVLRIVYSRILYTERTVMALAVAVGLMFVGLAIMVYPRLRLYPMIKIVTFACASFTGMVVALGPLAARGLFGLTQKDILVLLAGVALCAGSIFWGLRWRKRKAG